MVEEIKDNLVFLVKNLTNLNLILIHCRQNDIVTNDETERIMAGETSLDRNGRFFDIVMKKTWAWEKIKPSFILTLQETSNQHCADAIISWNVNNQSIGLRKELIPNSKGPKTIKILESKWWPEEKKLPPTFLERKEGDKKLVAILEECMMSSETKSRVINKGATISGMGGVGKTTMAKWFATEFQEFYDHIIWIDSGEGNISTSFKELAKELKVDQTLRVNQLSRTCFSKLEKSKCLFIFDNAEYYQGLHGIRDVLPKHDNFHTIITSRTREWGTESGDGEIPVMHLTEFPTKVSIDFLTMNLKDKRYREEQVEELSILLGNLPLALQIAVTTINTKQLSVTKYIERITKTDHIITQKFDDYEKTINQTMKISLDAINNHESDTEKAAQNILLLLGYLKPDLVELKLFETIENISDLQTREAIELLEKYSLITTHLNPDGNIESCSINTILQQVIRHNSRENEDVVLNKILSVKGFLTYKLIPYEMFADEEIQSLFVNIREELVEKGMLKVSKKSSRAVEPSPVIPGTDIVTSLSNTEERGPNVKKIEAKGDNQPFENQHGSTTEDTKGVEANMSAITKRQDDLDPVIRVLEKSSIYYFDDQELGRGATSTVYRGYFEVESRTAAVKKLDLNSIDLFEREIDILRDVDNHINVVRYFASESFKSHYYFAMELGKCTLEQCVDKKVKGFVDTPLEAIKKYVLDACRGLGWLHRNNILHRDIKPTNIVIFQEGNSSVAKLVDFGHSRKLTSITDGTNSLGKGTSDWMSPEGLIALDKETKFKTTPGVDVFSLGATMFYSLSGGNHPFGSRMKRLSNIVEKPPTWQLLKDSEIALKNLLSQMMEKDPTHRPNIGCVLEHPYFWDGKTQLDFIHTVSNSLAVAKTNSQSGLTNQEIEIIRNKIDNHMNTFFDIGNWQDKFCPKVKDLLLKYNKNYKADSTMKLVEFIRDKYQHKREWDDSLKEDDVFGKSDEKYIMYFTDRFPALIPVLYTVLQDSNLEKIESLKSKFFPINVNAIFSLAVTVNA